MHMNLQSITTQIERDGYLVLSGVFSAGHVDAVLADLSAALERNDDAAIRSEAGTLYAARNLMVCWPAVTSLWQTPRLVEPLAALLGPGFGLVRVLYFDKPPQQSWALPWHKDMTIAVRDNRLPSTRFTKPTRKAGVPHVEAPQELLQRMLFARIHLDGVTEENGPLKVLPGSHRTGKSLSSGNVPPQSILVERGDVLLIRPLVEHSSGKSHPDTVRHRRILHLEFAADPTLPDGYAWHDFVPAASAKFSREIP
ncbi:MAG TPA: phytanoyl-CoA dioxygenase family protein [Gemmataceae bacterium]|jgi:ectoine hydroxylase-related dioxygenase (phytanoyl-CoA dioxygenase family)|nr:phytanoyl-CoA dioxygenase family protein [Gemmataceae bacterium]